MLVKLLVSWFTLNAFNLELPKCITNGLRNHVLSTDTKLLPGIHACRAGDEKQELSLMEDPILLYKLFTVIGAWNKSWKGLLCRNCACVWACRGWTEEDNQLKPQMRGVCYLMAFVRSSNKWPKCNDLI